MLCGGRLHACLTGVDFWGLRVARCGVGPDDCCEECVSGGGAAGGDAGVQALAHRHEKVTSAMAPEDKLVAVFQEEIVALRKQNDDLVKRIAGWGGTARLIIYGCAELEAAAGKGATRE